MGDFEQASKEEVFMSEKELAELCVPILKVLIKNFHPHTTIIINSEGIRVEETSYGLPVKVVDNCNNL